MQTLRVYKPMGHQGRSSRHSWGNRVGLVILAVGVLVAVVLTRSLVARPAELHLITIPAGTELVAVLDRTLSTATVSDGQTVSLKTREALRLDSTLALPAGVLVRGRIARTRAAGKAGGAPELTIQFTEMEWGGVSYLLIAEPFRTGGPRQGAVGKGGTTPVRIRLLEPVTIEYAQSLADPVAR